MQTQLYIDGKYVDSSDGNTTPITSPVTGEVIAQLSVPTEADLNHAIAVARKGQAQWRKVGVWQRAEILHKVGDLIAANREKLSHLLTLEQGKPITESYADVDETAVLFHLHAEDAVRLHGETLPTHDTNKRMWTFYQAVGTWAIVIPWNFPVLMFSEFAAPGLATGNALVVKPPTHTALTLLTMVEILEEAGLPPGLVNILPGEGDFGAKLVAHEGIDAIGFIGSSATAEKIVKTAGLKRCIIEASGNGPVVVLDDADLAKAAQAAVVGAYYNAGQVCCATGRVLVHRNVHKEFVEEVKKAAAEAVLGDPFDEKTTLGPMNNERTASKVDEHLNQARELGFDIVVGGNRSKDFPTDLYYEFTVVDNVDEKSLLSTDETFGPVVPIIVGEDDEDLLRLANQDALGLQGAVFTKDFARAYYFVENMRTGQVIVNDSNGYWDINMPFGGVGGTRTGWGRIGGKHTLLDMSDLRTGVIDLS
ncbi:aldehyde dehydrogenase family protein [Corynebacterium felinum]|uniref:Succinate-semialdehyde dehydrogenase/glutarate-semialdehyde dehydrogenase n=1 Tax=Corynebacterium felinum TaxID=131318 RepID=A0ABU2B9I0_9CORY|nr:aldehyde dehydrogenase family protein [Corynebacterium felinum]MDF5821703.1 aldehyde dehydrogenase family protein [Corynebacterium felinum]MDR7355277.1 succinate-semialdehyde dehydrogenase/glutarate-semialdehyde dehydrogenase [Corynebacterium felinum]WJY94630.1 Glutarate-semialdehyde dehydrogenase DavD [Corynebacterium felinum]